MLSTAIRAFAVLMLLLIAFPVLAQVAEPTDMNESLKLIIQVIDLMKNGQYLMAGAAATLVIVFAIKKFALPKLGLKPGILPLVSAVLGLIVGLAIAVLAGATPIQALVATLSGPVASTLWDALVKYFFAKDQKPA